MALQGMYFESVPCIIAREIPSGMQCPLWDADVASFCFIVFPRVVSSPEGHQDDLRTESYAV